MITPTHDLLVLGDLHLGGSLRPPVDFKARREMVRLDRELAAFLRHQATHPNRGPDGRPRPWTLVLNGDCIDFLHMGLVPAELGGAEDDEAMYGLSFDESRSRWKLAWIVAYHRRSFEALCRFIEAGHRVVFIAGNHDADLCFKAVQVDLRGHIAAFAKGDRRAVMARIGFSDWFVHEPGRAWFEHGHRFDAYNTFPDPLTPIPAEAPVPRLAPTFSHWGLRFFANRV
ncbi:MAG: metallophosphoesterase, partial [Myxococcales bacterium]|nr:metallophosphoesterase [Myxococcales bacterium]